ncbi:MAG: recombinase family protein [Candidatus Bathyarchaeia archaeon]
MRAAIYCRVSTSDGGQNPDVQLLPLREFIQNRGWQIVGEFIDKESGLKEKRSGFSSVMELAKQRNIDAIVVASLDRWGRSLKQLVNTLDELASLGVSFVSLRESLDFTTPTGQLMTHLLGAFAQFEVALIKQRVKAGIANARARGERIGRPKKDIDLDKLLHLRKQGVSFRAIAKQMGVSPGLVYKMYVNLAVKK